MNGQIAELIALAGFGNAYFRGDLDERQLDLLKTNSTFQYVRSVEFSGCQGGSPRMSSTRGWYEDLRERGVSALWLKLRMRGSGAVVNDAGGELYPLGPEDREAWSPTWEPAKSAWSSDTRVWQVEYRCSAFGGELETDVPSLSNARQELSAALESATAFSRRHELEFTNWFITARNLLDSEAPEAPYHPDMLPPHGYSLGARQLLAACTRSWVFGGAGSWNEVGGLRESSELRAYDHVTRSLLTAVMRGFEVATNSVVR